MPDDGGRKGTHRLSQNLGNTGFIGQLEYISQLEDMDNRLDVVCGLHAADPLIRHGVSFEEYLYAEKYYQKFVETQNMEWLDNVAMWLYRDADGRAAGYGDALDDQGRVVEEMTLTPGERVGTMLWYGHVKRVMANSFPHFSEKHRNRMRILGL